MRSISCPPGPFHLQMNMSAAVSFTEPLSLYNVLWLHVGITGNYPWIRRIFGTYDNRFQQCIIAHRLHPSESQKWNATICRPPLQFTHVWAIVRSFSEGITLFHLLCLPPDTTSFLTAIMTPPGNARVGSQFLGAASIRCSNVVTFLCQLIPVLLSMLTSQSVFNAHKHIYFMSSLLQIWSVGAPGRPIQKRASQQSSIILSSVHVCFPLLILLISESAPSTSHIC